ncbi:hypothetical protein [Kitasatospora sp. NPDC050543]|uniref:hypothetical protein n=1 Tax=Kitasatospora sp. NPDC050543 TaxID=3364054 RepID=UPI0037A9A8E0
MSMVHLQPPADPKSSTLYLDWLRVGSPGAEQGAQELLDLLRTGLGRAHEKPGRFLDELKRHAHRLPAAHLPWFWDTVGHRLGRQLPRLSGQAYQLARQAESAHGLPVDEGYHRANALLFAGLGVLPGKEVGAHQRRLSATLPPDEAYREFLRFVAAWSAGGAAPPADLHTRLRAAAKAAGHGPAEDTRVLGEVLGAARGRAVPDALLDGAARLFATHQPAGEVQAALVELFPSTDTDTAAWIRLLRACGAAEAMAQDTLTPESGLAGWLARLPYEYSFARHGGGIMRRQLPDELLDLLPLLAARLRREGIPVRLHETRWRDSVLDADLADACLAAGIPVETPPQRVTLQFWGERARRDLTALAADPVLGARLEGTVHGGLRRGTALTRLPENPGIARSVHARTTALLDALAGGGLAAAEEAVTALEALLDRPTTTALDGIEEALAALDLTGPLLRTLRAGLPEELGWPALEEALAELGPGEPAGVTSTWPVLTVFTARAAVAVDHRGRRADCTFTLPGDATAHYVHYAGGDFLISWTDGTAHSYPGTACWASRPEDVFAIENHSGLARLSGLGYQFETADGTGRHDGERVLRPGGHEGAGDHELQLSDGHRLWSSTSWTYSRTWQARDLATGEPTGDTQLPAFFAEPPLPEGHRLCRDLISLAPLPAGAGASPLGHREGLAGFRVTERTDRPGNEPGWFRLEGTDGRSADFRADRRGQDPWGIVRLPAGGAECVITDERPFRCYDAQDNSLLWQADFTTARLPHPAFWHFLAERHPDSSRALRAAPDALAPALLVAARAARAACAAEAPGASGPSDSPDGPLRAELGRLLPGLTDPRITSGVIDAARRTEAVLRRREELSRRVAVIRSGRLAPLGRAPDTGLLGALRGLVEVPRHHASEPPSPQPAILTALAADGAHLGGRIDEQTRRLSAPARTRDWTPLLGRIDAAAWRLVTAATVDGDRPALAALLRCWAEQPFAAPGSWRLGEATGAALTAVHAGGRPALAVRGDKLSRLAPEPHRPLDAEADHRFLQPAADPVPEGAGALENVTVERDDRARLARLLALLAERGPVRPGADAVDAFVARTGVRRVAAQFVLDGLPERADHRANERLLTVKPYQATKEVASRLRTTLHRLGTAGRLELLAAALPDDPAQLWEPGGAVAAAERMAEVWARLVGVERQVDDLAAAQLEQDLGLSSGILTALARPAESDLLTTDRRVVLGSDTTGSVWLHLADRDGRPAGTWFAHNTPYAAEASALVWALTERPVGDAVAAGAAQLYDRLSRRLDAPGLLVPAGFHRLPGTPQERAAFFGPGTHPVLSRPRRPRPGAAEPEPVPEPASEQAGPPVVHDDGLLLVPDTTGYGRLYLRPAALTDQDARRRVEQYCAGHGLDAVLLAIRQVEALRAGGGLERMVRRAADTPVPAGGYEANPLLSARELVDEVARELAIEPDAAALLLQLLALLRPTDRNVRRWNGWTPARHRAAQEQLVAAGLVESDKRPRAGRSVFARGPWVVLRAPELPVEEAKLTSHLAVCGYRKEAEGPFIRLLPPRPLHELFAEAWQAYRGG